MNKIEQFEMQAHDLGHATLTDIASIPLPVFLEAVNERMDEYEAKKLFEKAKEAASLNELLAIQVASKNSPVLKNTCSLKIAPSQRDREDFESLFGTKAQWTEAGSVASMFSPAAYLTELYKYARPLHEAGTHWNLEKRRPDLKNLLLNQENMDEEISTLALSNEILMGKARKKDENTTIDADNVLYTLAHSWYSRQLPYHKPFQIVNDILKANLSSFNSLENIIHYKENGSFKKNNPNIKFDSLSFKNILSGISPSLYTVFLENIKSENTQELLKKYLGQETSTGYDKISEKAQYFDVDEEIIVECGKVFPDTKNSQFLEYNKIIRLYCATGLSISIIKRITNSAGQTQINKDVIELVHVVRKIGERYNTSVEDSLILAGKLVETCSIMNEKSQFERLFSGPSGESYGDLDTTKTIDCSPGEPGYIQQKNILKFLFRTDDGGLEELVALAFGTPSFTNDLEHLSRLYAFFLLARIHSFSITQLKRLQILLNTDSQPSIEAFADLLYRLTSWLEKKSFSVDDFLVMTDQSFAVEKTPEMTIFAHSLHNTLIQAGFASDKPESLPSGDKLHTLLASDTATALEGISLDEARGILCWCDVLSEKGDSHALAMAILENPENFSQESITFFQKMKQLAAVCGMLNLSLLDLRVLTAYAHDDAKKNLLHLTFDNLTRIDFLATLVVRMGKEAVQVVDALLNNSLQVQQLAIALGLSADELGQAAQLVAVNIHAPLTDLDTIDCLLQWQHASAMLKISPVVINKILTLPYPETIADISDAATDENYTKWHACSQNMFESLSKDVYTSHIRSMQERLSSALSFYEIFRSKSISNLPDTLSRNALYEYLLIDNQVSPHIITTRLAEAVASLQLYCNRTLVGIEDSAEKPYLAVDFFSKDWELFNKRYSTWQAGKLLSYYPENYLDPTMRIGQTSMMDTLIDAINQCKVNDTTLEAAFTQYLKSFEEVADLYVVSGFHDGWDNTQGFTYFIGCRRNVPNKFFWRRADSGKFTDGKYVANAWSEWREISLVISPYNNLIHPVIFLNRLYIVWIEQGIKLENEKHIPCYEIKISHICYDNSFSAPYSVQTPDGFSVDLPNNSNSQTDIRMYCTSYGDSPSGDLHLQYDASFNEAIIIKLYGIIENFSSDILLIFPNMDTKTLSRDDALHKHLSTQFTTDTRTSVVAYRYYYFYTISGGENNNLFDNKITSTYEKINSCQIEHKGRYSLFDSDINVDVHFNIIRSENFGDMLSPVVNYGPSIENKYITKPDDILEMYLFEKNEKFVAVVYNKNKNLYYICNDINKCEIGKIGQVCILYGRANDSDFDYLNIIQDITPEVTICKNIGFQYNGSEDRIQGIQFLDSSGEEDFTLYIHLNEFISIKIPPEYITVTLDYDDGHPQIIKGDEQNIDVGKFIEKSTNITFYNNNIEINKLKFLDNTAHVTITIEASAYGVKTGKTGQKELDTDPNKRRCFARQQCKLTITKTETSLKGHNLKKILSDTNGAQYMQWDAFRVRLNTLFASQLTKLAEKGKDALLSLQTQELIEPILGKGFFITLGLPQYDRKFHGDSRAVVIEFAKMFSEDDHYACWSGQLFDNSESNTVSLFCPYPEGGYSQKQYLHVQMRYANDKYTAEHSKSIIFEVTKNCENVTISRGPESSKPSKDTLDPRIVTLVTIDGMGSREAMDFSGANALYLWELFYYTPMLIVQRLYSEQYFDQASEWLKYIWNPSGYVLDGHFTDYYWNVRPLNEDTSWNADPLQTHDPDAVAQNDPMHYKLLTFMRHLDLLIAKGDAAYRKLERDTLNEAKMWYMQVSHLLGPRPVSSAEVEWKAPTLHDAADAMGKPRQKALANIRLKRPSVQERNAEEDASQSFKGFKPQMNEVMLGYWSLIKSRLYNLRHFLSIDGEPLHLPIYAPPADPRALLSASVLAAQGIDNLPYKINNPQIWRFPVLLEKARAMAGQLSQFGGVLLSFIERQDGEALSQLLQTQGSALWLSSISLQNRTIEELDKEMLVLQEQRIGALQRMNSYAALVTENISIDEARAMSLQAEASDRSIASNALIAMGGALNTAAFIVGMADGPLHPGDAVVASGNVMNILADSKRTEADKIALSESYRRRLQEWKIQRDDAQAAMKQFEAQLKTHEVQRTAATMQKTHLELQQKHTKEQFEFLQRKFSNKQLYSWLRNKLSILYYQFYDQTVSRCMAAQVSYCWETGKDGASFISPGIWQSAHAGLMSGEMLLLDLAKMENAYQQWEGRALEVERTVPLAQVYRNLPSENAFDLAKTIQEFLADDTTTPASKGSNNNTLALEQITPDNNKDFVLKATVDLSALNLKHEYPSHDNAKRRIKQISVSLPALLGPYQDVQAELSYDGGNNLAKGCRAIAVSHGMNDSGQFLLGFNDSRYLPFEGVDVDKGCVFTLSFFNAKDTQKTLLRTVSDIILHVRYTIRTQETAA